MIIGLAVFAVYLYFFIGFSQIFQVLQEVNLTEYLLFYSLAIIAMLLIMFCYSASWKSLMNALSIKIGYKTAFLYYWVGYFVDLIVPCQTICGEVTRLYLVQKETKNDYGAIAAAGVTNRIVMYSIVTCGLFLGVVFLLVKPNGPSSVLSILLLALVAAIVYLAFLLYLALDEHAADKLTSGLLKFLGFLRIKKFNASTTSVGLRASLSIFHQGFKTFRSRPRALIRPLVFQISAFCLNLILYILVFYSLGFHFLFIDFFIVVYLITGIVQDASASFSVGSLEIILTSIFIVYGIKPAVSGIAAVLLRTLTFWFPILAGYVIVQFVGAKKLLAQKIWSNLHRKRIPKLSLLLRHYIDWFQK
jgi:uncharacterized protein (TIRG00374 family)